jgi:hypothetical protein
MTKDDVIRMATEAGLCSTSNGFVDWIDAGPSLHEMGLFADQILEEVAQEIAKLPFGDTASSFAVFVRQMKVNRSDNESGRSPT